MLRQILIVFFLIPFSCVHSQSKILLPYFSITNIHPEYRISATRIFKNYLEYFQPYEIILNEDTVESYRSIKEKAIITGADHYLLGELNRLGEKVIVDIEFYETNSGIKVWSGISKAVTPEELEKSLASLAQQLGSEDISQLHPIAESAAPEKEAIYVPYKEDIFGISVGGVVTFINQKFNRFPAGFGFTYSNDMRSLIADANAEMYLGQDVFAYMLNLDLQFPFLPFSSTPYVSGSLGFSGMRVDNFPNPYKTEKDNSSGLMATIGTGYLLNRFAPARIKFSLRGFYGFYQVFDHHPKGVLLNMILLFK